MAGSIGNWFWNVIPETSTGFRALRRGVVDGRVERDEVRRAGGPGGHAPAPGAPRTPAPGEGHTQGEERERGDERSVATHEVLLSFARQRGEPASGVRR